MSKRTRTRLRFLVGCHLVALWTLVSGPAFDRARIPPGSLPTASDPFAGPWAVRALIVTGDYRDAEATARRLGSQIEAPDTKDDLDTARVLDALVEALMTTGKAVEARPSAERALAIKERMLGSDDLEVATSLENLGRVVTYLEDWAQGTALQQRALEIRRSALGPDHPLVAESLYWLGSARERVADWVGARQFHEAALAIRERKLGPDHRLVAQSLNPLGNLSMVDDLETGQRLHERALRIRERALGANHIELANSLHNLGYIAKLLGDYDTARRYYERMLEIQTRALGPEHPDIATGMVNLAVLFRYLGEVDRTISLLEHALAIDEKFFGTQHASVARDLNALAITWSYLGDHARARPVSERALAIMSELRPPGSIALTAHLNGLGVILARLGRSSEARLLFERAVDSMVRAQQPFYFSMTNSLLEIGRIQLAQGDPSGARDSLARAQTVVERAFGDEGPQLAAILTELARIDRSEGKLDSAVAHALRGEAIAREHLQRMARRLSEREVLRYEETRVDCLDVPLSILSSAHRSNTDEGSIAVRTWDAIVRSRALLLDEMGARHRSMLGQAGEGASPLVRAVDVASMRYASLFTRGPGDKDSLAFHEEVRTARAEMERAQRELAQKSDEFRGETARSRIGLREVLGALPARSALVALVRYDANMPSYLALVSRGTGSPPVVVALGSAERIDSLVRRWRDEAAAAPAESTALGRYVEAGESLRRAVWDPVARRLEGISTVFLVPDGELSLVNWGTLPTAGGHYLVETGPEMHYLSAERDLVSARPRQDRRGGLLVLGGVDFDADTGVLVAQEDGPPPYRGPTSDCESFRSLRFASLPASLTEAQEVESLWTQQVQGREEVVQLTGGRATESAFKRLAAGKSVIHLATHDFQVDESCASSPRPTTSSSAGGADLSRKNPLWLSGVALAGANRRADLAQDGEMDDGILTAEEIATLDLRSAEWVVLSACASGVGPVQKGEGVLGLRRAFHVAGANTLIVSLWSVADNAARDWMRGLYEGRTSGLSTAQAVRRADRRILDQHRRLGISTHPFFWGSFVATESGDP